MSTQQKPLAPALSIASIDAARRAVRVLVSEGIFASEAEARSRLWPEIQDTARREILGDFTLDQITPGIIAAAARELRRQRAQNAQVSRALVEAEERAATGLRRASATHNCGAPIYWDKHPNTGRPHPFNLDGSSHLATCPDPKWSTKK